MDADESDDYISDTEMSIAQSQTDLKLNEDAEDKAAAEADIKIKDEQKPEDEEESKEEGTEEKKDEQAKKSRKPRTHNLANIDAKGIKILRKIARFLLK